ALGTRRREPARSLARPLLGIRTGIRSARTPSFARTGRQTTAGSLQPEAGGAAAAPRQARLGAAPFRKGEAQLRTKSNRIATPDSLEIYLRNRTSSSKLVT